MMATLTKDGIMSCPKCGCTLFNIFRYVGGGRKVYTGECIDCGWRAFSLHDSDVEVNA